jgi:alcohol dehydrogenase
MNRKVYAAAAQAGASYCWFFTEANGDQLREIAALVDRGAIKPVIDREFASSNCRQRLPISRRAARGARWC